MEIKQIDKKEADKVARLLKEYWQDRQINITLKKLKSYLEQGHSVDIKKNTFLTLTEDRKSVV